MERGHLVHKGHEFVVGAAPPDEAPPHAAVRSDHRAPKLMRSVEDLRTLLGAAPAPYSAPEIVSRTLREAILRGILPAGQQLRQSEIARQLGVSHIPVREGLRQLEAEGLVRLRPNRGFEVAEFSPHEVEELYEIRIPLECAALRLAIPHLTPDDLARAERILDAIDEETDPGMWSRLNTEFHAGLYDPSGRQRLLTLIRTLRTNVDRYLRLYIAVMQRKAHSQSEHRRILAAVRGRDVPEALAALEEHLGSARRFLLDYLRHERRAGKMQST